MTDAASTGDIGAYADKIFSRCGDVFRREIPLAHGVVTLAAFNGFSSRDYIADFVVKPLLAAKTIDSEESLLGALAASEAKSVDTLDDLRVCLLCGMAVVWTDTPCGVICAACAARNDPSRSVSEPDGEVVVRGPREGFVESAETNTALLRKRLRTEKMKVETLSVGKYSATSVRIVYLEGVADEGVVARVKERLSAVKLPAVVDSGYLEQFLSEKVSLFTEVGNSEKPDKVAAKLVEGRVAVIADGSPVVLTVPYLFVESVQSAEDYLKTPFYASFVRLLRLFCLMISLYLPAFYVAVLAHHPNDLPHLLYEKIVEARHDVPFGVFGELAVILLIFEIIREVGVRMPGAVGDAVSIVAGLVLGDAAVEAGIASAPVIMVTAFTAICTFMAPPFMNALVLVRLANATLARLFGVAGVAASMTFFILRLCRKTSFGVPYFLPFSPPGKRSFTDGVLVMPKTALAGADRELKESRS